MSKVTIEKMPKRQRVSLERKQNLYGYVFVLPVEKEIDLKRAASAVGEKSVEMIHVKDITKTTGYVRGGCSPVGMKKAFPTYFDESVLTCEKIAVSAGQRGVQVILNPEQLAEYIGVEARFEETNWDAILAGVDSGRFDWTAHAEKYPYPRNEPSDYSEGTACEKTAGSRKADGGVPL